MFILSFILSLGTYAFSAEPAVLAGEKTFLCQSQKSDMGSVVLRLTFNEDYSNAKVVNSLLGREEVSCGISNVYNISGNPDKERNGTSTNVVLVNCLKQGKDEDSIFGDTVLAAIQFDTKKKKVLSANYFYYENPEEAKWKGTYLALNLACKER